MKYFKFILKDIMQIAVIMSVTSYILSSYIKCIISSEILIQNACKTINNGKINYVIINVKYAIIVATLLTVYRKVVM